MQIDKVYSYSYSGSCGDIRNVRTLGAGECDVHCVLWPGDGGSNELCRGWGRQLQLLQSAPRCFCCFPSQRTRGFVIRWSLGRGREAGTSAVIRRLQPSFTIACNFERSFILMAHTRPFPYLCAFLSQSVETICNAEPGPGPGYATLQPGTRGRGHTSMARLPSGGTLVTISSLTHNRQHSTISWFPLAE